MKAPDGDIVRTVVPECEERLGLLNFPVTHFTSRQLYILCKKINRVPPQTPVRDEVRFKTGTRCTETVLDIVNISISHVHLQNRSSSARLESQQNCIISSETQV